MRVIESDRAIFFEDDLVSKSKIPRPVTLREDYVVVPMPIVSLPADVMLPVVHGHDQALPKSDDIVVPLVDEQEHDSVVEEEVPLRKSQRMRKPTISDDYIVYLQ